MFQNVNVVALERATDILVGPQVREMITNLYQVIDQAMYQGHQMAQQDIQVKLDEAFRDGVEDGRTIGYADALFECNDWNDGYLAGVRDARAQPAIADETVEAIMAEQAQDAAEDLYDDDDYDY